MSNNPPDGQQELGYTTAGYEAVYAGDAIGRVSWGWREIAKALLVMIVGTVLLMVGMVGLMAIRGSAPDDAVTMTTTQLFWLGTAVYLFVILGVYLFAVRRAEDGWRMIGWRPFASGWLLAVPLLTVVQLTGMALINALLVLPFVGSDFENPQIEAITGGNALTITDLLLLMVLIAVVAPLAEEIFFRGMLYPVLRRRWSVVPAIVINGLLFSAIHLIPPLLPGLFFVGIVLAWVRERSGSLIPCILLHAMQNGIVLLGIYAVANGMGG